MLSKNREKFVKSLHRKKEREEEGVFIVEGRKIVQEVIDSGWVILHLFCKQDQFNEWHERSGFSSYVETVFEDEMDRISMMSGASEVLAVVRKPAEQKMLASLPAGWYLMMDGIRDPGNMGAILRIADWFGFTQIFAEVDCVELYNPKVIQSSMGSFLRVNVQYTSLLEVLDSNRDFMICGASLDGENVYHSTFEQSGFLILGGESHGLRQEMEARINRRLHIPRLGGAESLNAAVAAGLLCSQIKMNQLLLK